MIKEFAVDPAVFARWDDCRYLCSLFSAGNGRVIANYPKKWKKMVYEAAKPICSDVELTRITEKLARMDDSVLLKRSRPGGNSEIWLENALQEHERLPFESIVSTRASNNVLSVADLDEAEAPIATPRGISVERSADAMANAVSMMFEAGNHFKFIDPYFSSTETYMQPMREFINRIAARESGANNITIEIICKDGGNTGRNTTFCTNVEQAMRAFLQNGMTLKITLIEEHLIHDRWILADWVGVKFGHGFGIGGQHPRVNIDLLDEATRQRHWDEYSRAFSVSL